MNIPSCDATWNDVCGGIEPHPSITDETSYKDLCPDHCGMLKKKLYLFF